MSASFTSRRLARPSAEAGGMLIDRTIYNADNLLVMSRMPGDCVDLIYLDPPFNSGKQWENPLKETGKKVSFKDTWTLADIHEDERDILALRYPGAAAVIDALLLTNGGSWGAYLTYMGVRLMQMHRLLKPTGLIYYHCDPVMSHGVKLLMDAIFGKDAFRNEIIWCYAGGGVPKDAFARKHDVILAYAKTKAAGFNLEAVRRPYSETCSNQHSDGTKIDKARGAHPNDWWVDLPVLNTQAKERIGYPTEKPVALLRRILKASSRPNDMVMDPFCGCGVTAAAAESFLDDRRRWIGIDIGTAAASVLRRKLTNCAAHLYAGKSPAKVKTLDESDLPPLPPIPDKEKVKVILYKGQGGVCNGCMNNYHIKDMHIDHILPQAKGGDNDIANLQLLCGNCNSKKGKKPMNELRRKIAAERIEAKTQEWREKGNKRLAAEKERAIAKADRQGKLA